MKVNTTTETVLALADGLDAGRGVMGPSPLAAVLRALVGERDVAVAIVERLPKTADGVPITPDMTLFVRTWGGEGPVFEGRTYQQREFDGRVSVPMVLDGNTTGFGAHDCYSTRAAAAGAQP